MSPPANSVVDPEAGKVVTGKLTPNKSRHTARPPHPGTYPLLFRLLLCL